MVNGNENFYTDLDTIPIYNFRKCIKGDLKFMFEDKKGLITSLITEKWDKLYNEYCRLTASNETANYYLLIKDISFLESRLLIAPSLVNNLLHSKESERADVIKELSEWKLKINVNKNIGDEVAKTLKILNNSKNLLKRKIEEYEAIKSKNENENGVSIQAQCIMINRYLGIKPDIHRDSVIMWLEYFNEISKIKTNKDNE